MSETSHTRGDAGRRPPKKNKPAEEPGFSSTISNTTPSRDQYLLNPVILSNLFKVFPHSLLADCRLVCKKWYRASLVKWRSTSSLIALHQLRMKDEICLAKLMDLNPKYLYRYDNTETDESFFKTPLRTFLAFMEQECRSKPYRQFYLSYWSFATSPSGGNPVESTQGEQDRFWELVGDHVTYLKLRKCVFQDASVFRKIIFQTCPNLQTLILDSCTSIKPLDQLEQLNMAHYQAPAYGELVNLKSLSVSRDEDEQLPITYQELLSHFPSLASLNLIYSELLDYNNENADTCDLILWINAIKVIRQHDENKLALKIFNVSPGFQVGHPAVLSISGMVPAYVQPGNLINPVKCRELCVLFQEMNLHSELLVVHLHCDVVDIIPDVLLLGGKSIQKIRAVRDGRTGGYHGSRPTPSSKKFPCDFPFGLKLEYLKELAISPKFCRDLEFMKWTPNLEKLQIILSDRDRGHRGTSVDTMILNSSEEIMADVKLLKLKELWMGYTLHDVEETRRLCGWMPNLEIATMFLDDEQFGIVCENWRKLKHLHVFGSRLGDKGITGMGFKGNNGLQVVRPSITLLTELNCFQFARIDSKLTDSSICNGFLMLPVLNYLEIASTKPKIGKDAMKAIQEKVPNCQILGSPAMRGEERMGGDHFPIRKRKIWCAYFD